MAHEAEAEAVRGSKELVWSGSSGRWESLEPGGTRRSFRVFLPGTLGEPQEWTKKPSSTMGTI